MNCVPLILTALFLTVFAVYLFFAVYILHINGKAALNRTFFAVCISLCVWSFGFAMSVGAADAGMAQLWRRFAVFGWAAVYALILHFLLILSGSGILKKAWIYPLLYGPAVLNIAVFAISGTLASAEYNMLRTGFGWISISPVSVWDVLFFVYYIGYVAVCLGVILRWKRKAADDVISRHVYLIVVSFMAALFLGSVTDVVLPGLNQTILPQMAPVFIILPISVFYYLVGRHGLMNPEPHGGYQLIMNDRSRRRLFHALSVIFAATGLAGFLYEYVFTQSAGFTDALLNSLPAVFIGAFFFVIQRVRSDSFRYALNMYVILLSIPAVSLAYIERGAYMSWVFPAVLMLVSLVFNKRSMLITVTAATIVVQLLIWLYAADIPYRLTVFDYAARIAFFVVIFLIGLFVNGIYISKLRENAGQIELQKMISAISYDFARVDRKNLDENVSRLLERIGRYYQADRSFIFLFNSEKGEIDLRYEWCRKGIPPEIDLYSPCAIEKYRGFFDAMSKRAAVYHEDVRSYAPQLVDDSDFLIDKNVRSLLDAPLESGGTMYGFLGFSSSGPMNITDVSLEILQTFANLIADKLKMVKAEENIEYLAYYDQLTGLPNRLLFADRVGQAIHLAARQEKLLGIVYIDLNSFKAINDAFGHSTGDAIIRHIGDTLKRHLRKSDTVARFGSDEFLVLINDISDCHDIPKVATGIMSLFFAPVRLGEQEFFVSASAGVAVYPIDGQDSETLLKNADLAMYKAKAVGANRFVLCTNDMKEEVRQNMMLSNSLYRSLERGELSVHYQPLVLVDTEKVIGIEALLRWKHHALGEISPTVFIPLAEKNGLINVIGEWVLRMACAQNKKWQDLGYPRCRISVNLSVVQLRNPNLAGIVSGILEETGLPPGDLELEITESAAMEESEALKNILSDLKALGISISIDDFGTEYSSLTRLRELPIDRLKIDMQFVRALEYSEKDQAITMTIISLAKNLGLQVTAEGVETALQLDFLRKRSCDEVQGFYYYRPMPPDELERIIF